MDVTFRKMVCVALVVAGGLALTGCSGVGVRIDGKCGSGSGCDVDGSITIPTNLVQARMLASIPIDAAGVLLDTTGSTIAYPGSGNVTLALYNASGSVVASKSFPWVKSGAGLIFANPSAVNAWESTNSNGVASINYTLDPFNAGYPAGTSTMAVTMNYQGLALASMRSTFTSPTGSNCKSCRQQ
ncbi:MAG: hypothetical protein JSR26_07795 [Proteobacteria bacterium]|nr:hypothetical protein [Pseudomonadota bacterium]